MHNQNLQNISDLIAHLQSLQLSCFRRLIGLRSGVGTRTERRTGKRRANNSQKKSKQLDLAEKLAATVRKKRGHKACQELPKDLPGGFTNPGTACLRAKIFPGGNQDQPEGAWKRPRGAQEAPKRGARVAKRRFRAPTKLP